MSMRLPRFARNDKQFIFRMPAEWEPHEAVWLAWPYDPVTFPGRVEKVEKIFVQIIKALHQSERVELLFRDVKQHSHILKFVGMLSNIRFHQTDYADVWTRDYAPMFVVADNRRPALVKWIYDAYGKKFPALLKDNETGNAIAGKFDFETLKPNMALEGGAIEVNGRGTLLTTEQCLLKRNPKFTKEQIEEYFKDYLGITNTIWLKEGIANDHTDGHIDDFVRFVGEDTILCACEEDQTDPNYSILKSAYQTLQAATDQDGKPFKVLKVPMPRMESKTDVRGEGTRLAVSYVNFYIGNTVVLVPTFNHENDAKALQIIKNLFPGRTVTSIDCSDLIYGGGTIHCLTREVPKLD